MENLQTESFKKSIKKINCKRCHYLNVKQNIYLNIKVPLEQKFVTTIYAMYELIVPKIIFSYVQWY